MFQVTRMLTGGFDVIGLFACASPDEWKSAQAKLRQVQFPLCLVVPEVAVTIFCTLVNLS